MLDLLPVLGIVGTILAGVSWMLWKSTINNKVMEESYKEDIEDLAAIIKAQDNELKILSDKSPTDTVKLLESGEF